MKREAAPTESVPEKKAAEMKPAKSLEEREREYAMARERIFKKK